MNDDTDTAATASANPSWAQTHIPTMVAAGRRIQRGFAAIPVMPRPVAGVVLAVLGILGILILLFVVGTDLSISVRP